MISQQLFWLILGLVAVYIAYRKTISNSDVNDILKVWDSDSPRSAATKAKLIRATQKRNLFRQAALSAAFCYTVIVINLAADIFKGWYVLALCGILFAYVYLKFGDLPTESFIKSKELPLTDEYRKREERDFHTNKLAYQRVAIWISAASLLLSANWAYQVQKNQSESKLRAMNEAAELIGEGWCANFWDIEAHPSLGGDYDVVKTGGWPCLTIASVSDIRFSEKGDELEMCLSYSLARSDALPEVEYSSIPFEWDSLCISDDYWDAGEGWDKDSIKRKLWDKKNISNELKKLQVSMCRIYFYRLSEEERNVYC